MAPLPLTVSAINEDAKHVLPEEPAIHPLLKVSDPVLLLLGVLAMLDLDSCCSH